MKKTEDSDAFFKLEHKHDNPVASLEYERADKFYVTSRKRQSTKQSKHNSRALTTKTVIFCLYRFFAKVSVSVV